MIGLSFSQAGAIRMLDIGEFSTHRLSRCPGGIAVAAWFFACGP